jgi:hypothetical protein
MKEQRVLENKMLFIYDDSTSELKGVPYKAILMPWAEQKDLKNMMKITLKKKTSLEFQQLSSC